MALQGMEQYVGIVHIAQQGLKLFEELQFFFVGRKAGFIGKLQGVAEFFYGDAGGVELFLGLLSGGVR